LVGLLLINLSTIAHFSDILRGERKNLIPPETYQIGMDGNGEKEKERRFL
jgi:hypothetical protein